MTVGHWPECRIGRFLVNLTSLLVLLFGGVASAAPTPSGISSTEKLSIRWAVSSGASQRAAVEVSGLTAAALKELDQSNWTQTQWQRLLSVYAEQGDLLADVGLPPMMGSYRIQLTTLRFELQFPPEPGVNYRAVLHPDRMPGGSKSSGPIASVFRAPARGSTSTTSVSHVYPSAEILPENLLKFYLHFSAPMSRGQIYDHIHLRDQAGKEIELPFLEIDEELWDREMKRLTLFIDPGRIKRGVQPHEEVGPALEAGKSYTLVLDQSWKDASGIPLQKGLQKAFQVGPPDRDPPEPVKWKIHSPKSETREPLTILFPEPMDHALAKRLIQAATASGELLEGETSLGDYERRWTFVPARPWRSGTYKLVVQTTLEDLAGNNVGKPFEVDLFEGVQRRLSRESVKLSFEVR